MSILKAGSPLPRVEISKTYPKHARKWMQKMFAGIDSLAAKNDVFVKIKPAEPSGANVQIVRRGIDHVADIPRYAMEHDTGDQVYISWENKVFDENMPTTKIENKVKEFFGYKD